MSRVRRAGYRWLARLGDIEAVTSGRPRRIAARAVNRALGRTVIRRIWRRW